MLRAYFIAATLWLPLAQAYDKPGLPLASRRPPLCLRRLLTDEARGLLGVWHSITETAQRAGYTDKAYQTALNEEGIFIANQPIAFQLAWAYAHYFFQHPDAWFMVSGDWEAKREKLRDTCSKNPEGVRIGLQLSTGVSSAQELESIAQFIGQLRATYPNAIFVVHVSGMQEKRELPVPLAHAGQFRNDVYSIVP
ncbi:hypothetical protein K2X33_10430 [bacterium]|nr:hypothetical protein [bacterium]